MYVKNHHPQDEKNTLNVPVQTFGDSFSADAYMKDIAPRDNSKKVRELSKEIELNPVFESDNKIDADKMQKKGFLGLGFEDLLLIGLLLLYMSDDDKREDKMIPVILSVLLLI